MFPIEDNPYWFIAIFAIVALVFPLIPLGLARLWFWKFAPRRPGPIKNDVYECGLPSKGDAWIPVRIDYYLYALVFLIVDVESIFLIPFAATCKQLPLGAVVAMLVFILLLAEGLVWAWSRKYLEWK